MSEIIDIKKNGAEGLILENPPITTFQQSLTHSALYCVFAFDLQQQRLVLKVDVVARGACLVNIMLGRRKKPGLSVDLPKVKWDNR